MNTLKVSQKGLNKEGGSLTGHFAYLSKTSPFGFPSKETLPEAPSTEPLERERERCSIPRVLSSSSQSHRQMSPAPAFPIGAPMKRDAHLQNLF
jgi:hypothetical protein